MPAPQVIPALLLSGAMLFADWQDIPSDDADASAYFEGRWAFAEEPCDLPSNWTILAGGNFVSEDLTGTWEWKDGKLLLRLTDLAVDEETGEAGGRFQMEGPVEILNESAFNLTIAPDVYAMKKCPETAPE